MHKMMDESAESGASRQFKGRVPWEESLFLFHPHIWLRFLYFYKAFTDKEERVGVLKSA